MTQISDPRRRRRRVLLGGSAGLVAFYAVGAAVMLPWVEDDLGDRVEAAAVEAGYEGVTADFSGQDATLRCAEPVDDPDDLVDLAERKWGVRVAKLDSACTKRADGAAAAAPTAAAATAAPTTTAASPATTAATTTSTAAASTIAASTTTTTVATAADAAVVADATLAAGSNQITLSGTVQTEEQRSRLLAAATAAFGEGNVIDQLELAADATATADGDAGVDGLAALIGSMTPNLVEGVASVEGASLSLTGVYVDDAARAAVTAAANDAARAAASAAGSAAGSAATIELTPRAAATEDQAAELEQRLNAAVGTTPIPFEQSSAQLTAAADPILDQVAALAREFAGVSIAVQGHTDSDGSDSANLALSQSRASTVRDALIERGVPGDQLVAEGFGETQPVVANDTPSNKALNRRVVFAVAAQ